MKKYIFILSVFIIISVSHRVNAQLKDSVNCIFTIDLAQPKVNLLGDKHSYKKLQANTKSLIRFQLINGNPFKYKYVINSSTVNLFQSTSATPIEDLYKKTLNNKAAADSIKLNSSINSLNDKMTALYAKLKTDSINRRGKNKTQRAIKHDTTTSKINLAAKTSLDSTKKANNIAITDAVNTAIFNDSVFALSIKKLGITSPNGTSGDKDSTVKILVNGLLVLLQEADQLTYDISEYKLHVVTEDFLDYSDYTANRDKFLSTIILIKSKFGDLNIQIELAAIMNNSIANNNSITVNTKKLSDELVAISAVLDSLLNIQTAYYTMPNDINGKNIDLIRMTVERHDKTSNALLDKNEYQIWIKGGLKIDVSAGLFITSIMDNKYFTVDSGTNAANQPRKYIYRSDMGSYGLGFGSMINISYRTGSAWVRPAFGVGALVSSTQKFQGLAGISLMLGKEERCVLHWGLSLGTVTALETSYQTSAENAKKPYSLGASNQVPTTDRFSFGNFFGFTYNLSGAKAKIPSITSASK